MCGNTVYDCVCTVLEEGDVELNTLHSWMTTISMGVGYTHSVVYANLYYRFVFGV